MAAVVQRMIVDVHTHVYLPRYAALLRQRTNIPRIISHQDPKGKTEERLVILSDEPAEGRPVGPQYWDRAEKLAFMNKHDIDISVVRCALISLYTRTYTHHTFYAALRTLGWTSLPRPRLRGWLPS